MLLRQHGPTSRHTSSVFPCSTYEPADSRPSTAPTSRHTTSECLYSLRYHLLSTDKFCVLATIRQTNALSLSDSRGLRLPWFIPSVLPSTCPHLLQFNEPTHVLVAPCSSSPSPGRCGFIRSSLPSPGQCGLHMLVALLVTAISGSVRPLSSSPPSPGRCGLSCSFCLSRRPADSICSDSPALRRIFFWLNSFDLVCFRSFVPTHGSD